MKRLRVLAALFVAVVAALGIWVASTGMRQGRTSADKSDNSSSAYDYQATDVVVTQMGPDGSLQYELTAKQISQEPKDGKISAQDLVMHHDPAGSVPGGPNRWTLSADHADLPGSGAAITLTGKVHAEGRPQNSRAPFSVATEELTYDMKSQEISTRKSVDVTWGSNTFHSGDLRLNIKSGAIDVDSGANGTYSP